MSRAVLMGLGVTGRSVAGALVRRGHDVVAFDDRINDDIMSWSAASGVEVAAPGDGSRAAALAGADMAIPAPGLPEGHPFFAEAASASVDIVSEFDLAAEWDSRPAVAVTGTDGKTTVVTLIERMLEASGVAAASVGNTDTPWVEAIDDERPDVFVVEASSFRLGHSRHFSPAVGAWLNFGPDHLDAHSSLETYELAKASIWSHLSDDALALANRDDAVVARHASALEHGTVETFGLSAGGAHRLVDGTLIVGDMPLVEAAELPRSLPHDIANGLAAAAAALHVGAEREQCAQVLREFRGLPHRVEFILEHEGVQWVNDSKATTPHASAAALGAFDSVVLLAGGRNKGLAFDDLTAHADRLRHVVALGEAADVIEQVFAPVASVTRATSMIQAIEQAEQVAQAGDVVLLSPACASFDWYRNYRHRGEDFVTLVRSRFDRETS